MPGDIRAFRDRGCARMCTRRRRVAVQMADHRLEECMAAMTTLDINGKRVDVDVPADTPLLWTLRDELGMTGTKFGCGMALCGACTVHLDGAPIRSCSTPVSQAAGKKISTIEAMHASPLGKAGQAAWVKNDVPQCGYCPSGQVQSAG